MTEEKIIEIQSTEIAAAKMENVQTRPNSSGLYGAQAFSPTELKKRMDALPMLAVEKVNELIEKLHDGGIASDMKVPSVFGEETITLSAFLKSLKEMLSNGGFASIIKTGSNKDAMSVLAFLDYLQAQIGNEEEPDEQSLRKQIKDVRDALAKQLDKSVEGSLRNSINVNHAEANKRIDGIVGDVQSDITAAIEDFTNYVSVLTGDEVYLPPDKVPQPLRERVDALENRVQKLEEGPEDGLFKEVEQSGVRYVVDIPDDKRILPIGFINKLGGLSRTTDNLIPWDTTNRYDTDFADKTGTENGNKYCERGGITYTYKDDASISINGTFGDSKGNCVKIRNAIPLVEGTYVFGCETEGTGTCKAYLSLYNTDTKKTYTSKTFSPRVGNSEQITCTKSFNITGNSYELRIYFSIKKADGTSYIGESINVTIKPFLIRVDDKSEDEIEYKYTPYFEGRKDAKVTSIVSRDASGNEIGRYAIPKDIQLLGGYGLGNSREECNLIDFEKKTYTQKVDASLNALDSPDVTDISEYLPSMATLKLAAGGTVTFESADESGNDIGARCVSEISYLEVQK